jgi:ABC-type transport system involved in multi-copper enzyme maturation permease subunit
MNKLNVIYHLARADFLERTRRYSFLVTLVLIVFMAYGYVPSRDALYITLSVDGARGLYNSAWIGSLIAILTGITLPLVGFYLVKNAVERDTETRVGQIMATTPLTRPVYTLGKWLSNFAVLALITGVIALATIVLQLIIGEDRRLDLVTLLAPIIWVLLPTIALISAIAVLFETVGWLSGGLGNVIYFFACTTVTMASFMPVMLSSGGKDIPQLPVDVFGIGLPLSNMLQATKSAFPDIDFLNNSIGPVPVFLAGPLQTFEWAGVLWTPQVIAGRLFWIVVAIAVALLAALFFNRFDPARERGRRTKADKQEKKEAEVIPTGLIPTQAPGSIGLTTPRLTPLVPAQRRFNFARILLAELRLLRKDLHWRWFLVTVVLIIAGALLPSEIARQYILPFTWLWPILIWSALGTREARHHTAGMVFSAAHPLGRQLPAIYVAGVVVTALTGSGVAFNFLRAGDLASLFAWAVAVIFIPSLAIALAAWSGGSKLFEVVYLALWYAGPMNQFLPQLDFMGASDRAASFGTPLIFLIATLALMGIALIGRQRQLRG